MLLVGAGLLVRGAGRLRHVDTGFNPDSVLTMTIALPEYRYGDAEARRTFFTSALSNVQQIPGVRAAGFVNVLPLSTYDGGTRYTLSGRAVETGREPTAAFRIVTADYFSTLEIPVRAGRGFDSRDAATAQPVAIVNQTMARRVFGAADPIGQQLRLGRVTSTSPMRTIVGVVGDVLHTELTGRPEPEIYVPFVQAPSVDDVPRRADGGRSRSVRGRGPRVAGEGRPRAAGLSREVDAIAGGRGNAAQHDGHRNHDALRGARARARERRGSTASRRTRSPNRRGNSVSGSRSARRRSTC